MKYKHSNKFYKKQYIKYKESINNKSLFKNFESFKGRYKAEERSGKKNITKNFVYETDYTISFDTYKAERDISKKIGLKVKKKELLGMTTTEFAEKYENEIMHTYRSYKRQGLTTLEASAFISQYFFGS